VALALTLGRWRSGLTQRIVYPSFHGFESHTPRQFSETGPVCHSLAGAGPVSDPDFPKIIKNRDLPQWRVVFCFKAPDRPTLFINLFNHLAHLFISTRVEINVNLFNHLDTDPHPAITSVTGSHPRNTTGTRK
jgi:hypothetical protein